ncbi:hypothetical protein SCLCIDRAFT_1214160, partial [Scleroderma citrinum Foug A]
TPHEVYTIEKRRKLDAKLLECIFLGFAKNCKAYVCVHCPNGQIFESRDVVFNEGDPDGPSHVRIDESDLMQRRRTR